MPDKVIYLYTCALALAATVSSPWWLAAMLFSGKYREGFAERAGRVPTSVTSSLAGRRTVWFHAVSVGELLAAVPLIRKVAHLLDELDGDTRVVISTTTRTAQHLARSIFGADLVFYFPFDFPGILRRYFSAMRPRMLVLLETEFWPNCLHIAATQGVPVAVVNARISDRSYPRYLRLRRLWKPLLRPITLAMTQSSLDARRLQRIGVSASRISVPGNLKYDREPLAGDLPLVAALRQHLPGNPNVWVCGSIAAGEEELLLEAHAAAIKSVPTLVTILAPRHPERFSRISAMLPEGSLLRSRWMNSPTAIPGGTVFLLDSIGELAATYAVATLAFVGNSMVKPGGGQNPLEPAAHQVPILSGRYTQNFRAIAESLHDAGALMYCTPQSLAGDLIYLLTHPEQAAERGRRGCAQVQANRGATERTAQQLMTLLIERDPSLVAEPAS